MTPEVLTEMRSWLADCQWADMEPEDFEDTEFVTDDEVVTAVGNAYVGGVSQFIADAGQEK